ncbi:MAG: MMPL family transporter [Opitutales bacterium]
MPSRWTPWLSGAVLAATALAVIIATPFAFKADLSVRTDDLVSQRARQALEDSPFSAPRELLIFAADSQLWTPEKLEALRALQTTALAQPEVVRVTSLFSASAISGGFGSIRTSPYLQFIPGETDRLEAIRDQARQDPLMRGRLISPQGDALAIVLELKEGVDGAGEGQLIEALERALRATQGEVPFEQLSLTGSPAIQNWMSKAILADQVVLLPLAGVILLFCLGLLLRSPSALLLTLVNAGVASVLTMGLAGLLGWPVSLLGALTPLLVLIIGAAQDVHLVSEFQHYRKSGQTPADAVHATGCHLAMPLALTGVTTALGFGVNLLSDLPLIRDFGRLAAVAMLLRLALSFTVAPAWLRLLPPGTGGPKGESKRSTLPAMATARVSALGRRLYANYVSYPGRALAIFGLALLPCLLSLPQLEFNNDLRGFLPKSAPPMQDLQDVENTLGPTTELQLLLPRRAGSYRRPEVVQALADLAAKLEDDSRIEASYGLHNYIAQVHKAMLGPSAQGPLPDRSSLLEQYLIFFHRGDLRPVVSGDFAVANLRLLTPLRDSQALLELEQDMLVAAQDANLATAPQVLSPALELAHSSKAIASGQLASLGLLSALLWVIVASLFVSIRAGTIALAANLFPVAILFGVMAIGGIPFNAATALVAVIAMGIAVDDTLHLMTRYHRALHELNDERPAIGAALQAEFFPVTATTVSLVAGFAVLAFSSFVPVRQFGLLCGLVLSTAMIADLVLTPVLLSMVRLLTLWDVLGLKLRRRLFEDSPLLAGFSSWQIRRLVLLSRLMRTGDGHRLIAQDETGDELYVLLEGELAVERRAHGHPEVVANLKPGSVVGEIALVGRLPRVADVYCRGPCALLAFCWEDLERLRRRSPRLSAKLLLNLSGVLAQRLSSTFEWSEERIQSCEDEKSSLQETKKD